MNIVFGIDNNFVMQCGVTITSICINNPDEDITFYILTKGLAPKSIEALTNQVNIFKKRIYFHYIDEKKLEKCYLKEGAANGKISTYFRFLIPDILKEETKAIYLDSDLIIRKNLKAFWNTDISNYAIGVCPGENNDSIHTFNRLEYDKTKEYFNAGVLLINLEYWRRNNIFEKLMSYSAKMGPRLDQQDQDVLNFVLQDEKKILPITYNLQERLLLKKQYLKIDWHYFNELEEAIKDPAIIHYTSSFKPWLKECKHPYKEEWIKYMKKSLWKDYKPIYKYKSLVLKRFIKSVLSLLKITKADINEFRTDIKL